MYLRPMDGGVDREIAVSGRVTDAAVMPDGGRLQTRASNAKPGVHDPKWREPKYGCCLTLDSKESREDPGAGQDKGP